ncbi:MAG TPA: hypothetical protein GX404_09950, partial [Syntrophomonadaceae bacterium]|nr:hypothetical protein [Syntrophomonadaceae bacterium]
MLPDSFFALQIILNPLVRNNYMLKKYEATPKYTSRAAASTMVVIKGPAMIA